MIAKITIILLISIIIYLIINISNEEKFIILEKNHKQKENVKKNIKIPCKIWQTHRSNDLPESSYKNIMNMIKINKGFEYNFYDDADMKKYMEAHFDKKVNNAYNKIKPGAGKADIWRLAVILREGGIYIDVDKVPTENAVSFIDLIDPEDEMIHGRNWHIWRYDAPATNATICARPNHPVINDAFNSVIDSIHNDNPLKKMGKHEGWAKLECYTGTPHLWKALSKHTGNINMKEGKYKNGLVISNKIEDNLKQNPDYGDDLKDLKVTHWSQVEVFEEFDNQNTTSFPKIIHLIFWDFSGRDRDVSEIPEYNACLQSWKKNHKNWKLMLWNGKDMHEYVKNNFPQFYEKWNTLPRKIMKVDTFRFMLMYKFGGIYSDLDQESIKSMDSFSKKNSNYDIVLWCDSVPTCHNGMLLSKANKIFWLKFLEHIFNSDNFSDVLGTTGPPALYNFYVKNKKLAKIKTYYPRKNYEDQHYMFRSGDNQNSCFKKTKEYDNSKDYLVANWSKTPSEIHWISMDD